MTGIPSRCAWAAAVCVAAGSLCAFAGQPPDPIDVRVLLSQSAVRPGDKFQLAVEITTKGKYHIYGPSVSQSGLVSTSVSFDAVEGLTFGEPRYPPTRKLVVKPLGKEFAVYKGKLAVIIPVTVGKAIRPGRVTIRGRLRYQACTDASCLMPSREPFSIQVPIAAKGVALRPLHPNVFAAAKAGAARDNTVVLHVEGMT